MNTDDMELLRRYARSGSEEAFAALVSRHVNLVFSVAVRQTGDAAMAEEITQAVFIILARKAKLLGDKTILPGWLCRTARNVAANALTIQRRRQRREQEACMENILTGGDDGSSPTNEETWAQIAPLLDAALARLGGKDHDAIVLRFFENRELKQVGAALGVSEDAAKKRVSRALEKLRRFFCQRGIDSTAATIAETISVNSVQAAPVALVKTVTAVAVAKGATASISTLTIIKGALKIMAWTKMKTAVVVGAGILFAAGTTTLVVEKISHPKLSTTDLSWADDPKYWASDSRVLGKLPPVMIIRPTKFANSGGGVGAGNRLLYKNDSVKALLDVAYGFASTRTVFPQNMPAGAYDLMFTLPSDPSSVLPQEMARRFGFVAHKEMRPANVLLLEVANPNPPNLKPAKSDAGSMMSSGGDKTIIGNQGISTLAWYVEGHVNQPVLDRTGLKGNYDITLQTPWKWSTPSREMLGRALLDQLGLKLVPTNLPIEMLVVEKVK